MGGRGGAAKGAAIEGIDRHPKYKIRCPLVIERAYSAGPLKREEGVHGGRRAARISFADYVAIHLNFLQEVVQPEGGYQRRRAMR